MNHLWIGTFHQHHCTYSTGLSKNIFFRILFVFNICYVILIEWTFYYFAGVWTSLFALLVLFNLLSSWSGNSFSVTFIVWSFQKSISHVISYKMTKFHSLIVVTFWDIGQYVYCYCLFFRSWCHKFWH